jgi:hypothetical protein
MARRVNARTLTTKRAVVTEFSRHASPYVLLAAVAVPTLARHRRGRLQRADLAAVAAVAVAQPFIEWWLHRGVLHAAPVRVAGVSLDPGAAHRCHHNAPDDVAGALLGAGYAFADSAGVAATVGLVVMATVPLVGAVPVGTMLTAIAAGEACLAAYEWSHLLVHSGYRPHTAWFRRLRANHRRHHFRDETRSFGITSMWGDRLFGPAATPAA